MVSALGRRPPGASTGDTSEPGSANHTNDERLLAINAGSSRPESAVTFGWFAEQQWKVLVFPTFKASTQHGYKTVRKLPRQTDSSMGDFSADEGLQRNVSGGTRPKLSCGRSRL